MGNSLKSIYSRITTMQPAIDALSGIGIDVRTPEGEMRGVADILEQLAGQWGTLSAEQQQNMGVTLAGRYQLSRFLTLMQQYQTSSDVTTASVNSQGSAMREQAEYAQSLEARLNRLSNSGIELSDTLGDALLTDSIVVFTEAISNLANTSSGLISFVGLLPPVFGGVAVAVAMLSPKFRAAAMSMSFFQANAHGAAVASRVLTVSLKTLAASTGIGLVFAGVGFGIEKLISIMGDSIKRNEEFKNSQETSLESMSNERGAIKELVDEYERLSDIPEVDRNVSQEERYVQLQNELVTLLPHLKEGEDEKGNAIVANTERVREHIAVLEEQLAYEQKLASDTAEADIEISTSNIEKAEEKIAKHRDDLAKEQKKQQDLIDKGRVDAAGIVGTQIDKINQKIKDQYDIVNENEDMIASAYQATAQQILNMNESDLSSNDVSWIGQMAQDANMSETEIESLANEVANLRENIGGDVSLQGLDKNQVQVIDSITEGLSNGINEWEMFRATLVDSGIDADRVTEILGRLRNSEDDVAKSAEEAEVDVRTMSPTFSELGEIINWTNEQIADSSDEMGENGEAALDWSDRISNAKDSFKDLAVIAEEMARAGELDQATTLMQKEAYEALSAEVSPLNGLLESLAEGKSISAAEAMELINKEEALADAISIESGQVVVNEKAVKELRNTKMSSYADMQQAVINEAQQTANATLRNLQNYDLEIGAITNLKSAKQALSDLETDIQTPMSPNQRQVWQQARDETESLIEAHENMEGFIALAEQGLTEVGTSNEKLSQSSDKASKSAKDQSAELKDSTFVADDYNKSLEKVNNAISRLNSEQNNYAKHSSKYRKALRDEIKMLERKQKIMELQAKALRNQISSGNIGQTGIVTDSTSVTLPSPGGSGSKATGNGNQSSIWNYLKSQGFSDNIVAGIMGNLQMESNFNPSATNGRTIGVAQWLGGRRTNLQRFASQRGTSETDLMTQLDFMMKELNGSERRTMNWLQSNPNASATTVAAQFDKLFERSEGTHIPQRQKYANQALSRFSGSGGGGSYDATSVARDNIQAQNDASSAEAQRQQALYQAEIDLLNLETEIISMSDLYEELNYRIIESHIAEFDHRQKQLEDDMAKLEYRQVLAGEDTVEWIELELEREKLLGKQRDIQEEQVKWIEREIKTNKNLTASQKDRLDEEILNRTVELWQMEQEILDIRISMAEQIIGVYNEALEAQKEASVKAIDDLISEIDKEMEEADWNKSLRDKQKERQELLDELAQLAIDDSDSARKRRRELTDLLQEMDQELDDMLSDRSTELRKEALSDERDGIEREYDDIINDERRLAQMRKDIIQGSTKDIQKDLAKFVKDISGMTDQLGRSAVNNLVDMIGVMDSYLGGTGKLNIPKFDTGGYTGSFSGGRLAVLHQKELVLNESDTSNMMKLVDWTRGIMGNLRNIQVPSILSSQGNNGTTNELTLSLNIENMNGNKKDVDHVINESIKGFEKMGFKF